MFKHFFRPCLVFLCVISLSNTAFAQLEVYAEAAYLRPADEVRAESGATFKGSGSWSVGLDALYGKNQFSPLLGLHLQQMNYTAPYTEGEGRKEKITQLSIPVGLTYHLRPRTTSFNLMLSAAYAPYLTFEPLRSAATESKTFKSSYRFGLTLTLDYVYLGLRWQGYPKGSFGTGDKWTTTNGYVIGVRF